ncbi:MAG: hypothetical protein AAGF76_10620 [Pseudomonadota bacterium]
MDNFAYDKLLDWPFLAFLVLLFAGIRFHKEIAERLASISELTLGGSTKIKLGRREVDAQNIGDALTQAFQELEARVEAIEAQNLSRVEYKVDRSEAEAESVDEPPEVLKEVPWSRVFEMLNSEFWYARYVETLAANTYTSEDTMLEFLKERPDVDVYRDRDGGRWLAKLKSR